MTVRARSQVVPLPTVELVQDEPPRRRRGLVLAAVPPAGTAQPKGSTVTIWLRDPA